MTWSEGFLLTDDDDTGEFAVTRETYDFHPTPNRWVHYQHQMPQPLAPVIPIWSPGPHPFIAWAERLISDAMWGEYSHLC